jgi:hypothetical protein
MANGGLKPPKPPLGTPLYILLSPCHEEYVAYAKLLLNYFVKRYKEIYGIQWLTHNVHTLQHIADDYDTFKPLNNCSAFPYENHMKVLKKTVRKHHQPLQQAVNRYNEINNFKCIINESSQIMNDLFMKFLKQHNNGPLTGDCLGP